MTSRPVSVRLLPTLAVLVALGTQPLCAEVLPAVLPPVDSAAPANNKPVKVYIQSGQSNSLGFGRVSGAGPIYERLFLSADPSAVDCQMPVKGTAMMKMGVFQSEAKDAQPGGLADGKPVALGSTDAELPAGETKAWIELPLGGTFEFHPGRSLIGKCVVTINGREVYRTEGDDQPVITAVKLEKGKRYPITITSQSVGSAALWAEKTDLEGMGDLEWVIAKLGKFKSLKNAQGEWVERPDVLLCDAYMGKGASAPMSAKAVGPTFGPELGFGWVMGEFHDEPVIVMKADIGNRSLGWDILPPGTESWEHDGRMYPGYGLTLDENGKPVKPAEGAWYAGKQYDDYTASIHAVLDSFKEKYPQYAEQGFEVAGFVWWQGHKDGPNPGHNARYEQNLVNLIKAWRKEFNAPNATWTIATVGFHGADMPEHYVQIAQAQLNVADPKRHPELAGTVKTIDTRPFWRPAGMSPKNQDYHYNHNAETYMLVGDALGRAMAELKGGKAEYPSAAIDAGVDFIPDLPGVRGAEVKAMTPALKPIMLDALIPGFVATADKVPSYLRKGLPLEDVLLQKQPKGRKKDEMPFNLSCQLDRMIEFYELAGITDYSWKPVDEALLQKEWDYTTLDPGGKPDPKSMVCYRKVELPQAVQNWPAVDFDAAAAGWKKGKAPFGQKDGQLAPVMSSCNVGYCRCNTMPNTLWDKDLLLMRTTMKMPKFEAGKRYRLVVGGAGHPWSGDGYALYINGELVSEMTEGYYKSGGDPRGVFLFDEMQKAHEGKEVTVAIKAFLRRSGFRGKEAPPVGQLNAWIESAQLSPVLDVLLPSGE